MDKVAEIRLAKALSAQRETRSIEFKRELNPDLTGDWCEIIKDIVAIANSGGGVIVVGLRDDGTIFPSDLSGIFALDPADLSNRLIRYVGQIELDLEIVSANKDGVYLWALSIGGISPPTMFEKHGSYPDPDQPGKQKFAFREGTIYFRHGSKSEPGNNHDIRKSMDRQLNAARKELLAGLRKVVEAPQGSVISVTQNDAQIGRQFEASSAEAAIPVRITRDPTEASGTLLHEQVSPDLFGEINNVIETNRLLFPGRDRFLLGPAAYYRTYAERRQVQPIVVEVEKLLRFAIIDYSPFLYWATIVPVEIFAAHMAAIYLQPKGNEVSILLRVAALLGYEFRQWLAEMFTRRWGTYSQAPAWFHRCVTLGQAPNSEDFFELGINDGLNRLIEIPGELSITAAELLAQPTRCNALLSKACLGVFSGNTVLRSQCRVLDVLCHGGSVVERRSEIASALRDVIGDQLPDQLVSNN